MVKSNYYISKELDIGIIVIKGIIFYKHSNDSWWSNTNKILNIVNYTLQSKNICKKLLNIIIYVQQINNNYTIRYLDCY